MRRMGIVTFLIVAALTGVGLAVWSLRSGSDKGLAFLTAPVKKGDLVSTISATGTTEPEAAVDIGAQVAGVIVAFGTDKRGKPVTWGSEVEAGTVLARIDDSLYAAAVATAKAQVSQGEANVLAAQANVQASKADVLQQKANLLYATQNWDRAQKLGPSDALAQSAYDQYQANYEAGKANLAAAEAAVEQAEAAAKQAAAAVEQYQANLLTAQINFNYCTIKSPVKGVVIDRRVNIGQTVVSSLSAPSLFLIATDLRHIQAWVSVNEADVGAISAGQAVTFTVDAIPGTEFHGRVGQVRLNATMTQNVVTYTIEVDIENFNSKLLPYLTTNAKFEIARRKDVFLVPNAALRWLPRPEQIAPEAWARPVQAFPGRSAGGTGGSTVWVLEGKFVRPIPVRAGLTDGAFVEVEGQGLAAGLRVVTGEGSRPAEASPAEERNPFAPQTFRGQRPSQPSEQQPVNPMAPMSPSGPETGKQTR